MKITEKLESRQKENNKVQAVMKKRKSIYKNTHVTKKPQNIRRVGSSYSTSDTRRVSPDNGLL